MTHDGRLHVAVALDGAGWHPAAWREPSARPAELLTARYWVDLARLAEAGLVDFLTIEDSLAPPDARTDVVQGRLDAVMIAARVAPVTTRIGLVPSVTVTHTEPFHVSKAIATLDFVSSGRAGVRVQVSARPGEAAHFGRRTFPSPTEQADPARRQALARDLLQEAADYVEVLRRLWDSWEDDAEIRDVTSGRFIDRAKLHYIDFTGEWFSVRGPSITPRSPQGQPLVTALAYSSLPYRFAVGSADVVFVTPHDADDAGRIARETRRLAPGSRQASRRAHDPRRPRGVPRAHDGRGAPAQVATRRHVRPGLRQRRCRVRGYRLGPGRSDGGLGRRRGTRVPAPAGGAAGRPAGDLRATDTRAARPLALPRRLRDRDLACPFWPGATGQPLRIRAGRRMTAPRQMHLAAHFPGVNNTTVWSDPRSGSQMDFGSFAHMARTAERACFDFFFLAEGLRLREQGGQIYDLDVVGRPDTFTILSALAAVTDRLGLAGTINSTFNEPYEVARQFATLDHLSGGRAAWNVVTSWDSFTGENFRRGGFLPQQDRYHRAKQFMLTTWELFDSWRGDEIAPDSGLRRLRLEPRSRGLRAPRRPVPDRRPLQRAS